MQDLAIDLDGRERPMSAAAQALGAAGINIEGLTGPMGKDGASVGHILVENGDEAKRILEAAGLTVVGEREVVVVQLEDRPGSLWELLQRIGPRSYDLVYLATGTRLVLGGKGIDEVARILAAAA